MTLYLLKNTSLTEVTATVYDEKGRLVEDAYIYVMKYDITTNSYITMEVVKTNFEGQAILNLVLASEFYKFIIHYPLNTVVKEKSPTYIYTTAINLQITTGEDFASSFYTSLGITYDLVFNNVTNNFRYTYSDSENSISQACLKVYKIQSLVESAYATSCSASQSGTILVNVTNTTDTWYRADAFVTISGSEYFMDSEYAKFPEQTITTEEGAFWIFVLTVLFMFVGYWSKEVALIITPLPMLFGAILGIFNLSIPLVLSIEIVCVMVAIMISRRSR
jgi:hypothetical protein